MSDSLRKAAKASIIVIGAYPSSPSSVTRLKRMLQESLDADLAIQRDLLEVLREARGWVVCCEDHDHHVDDCPEEGAGNRVRQRLRAHIERLEKEVGE